MRMRLPMETGTKHAYILEKPRVTRVREGT